MTDGTKTQKKTVAASNGQKPVEGNIDALIESEKVLNEAQTIALVRSWLESNEDVHSITNLTMGRTGQLTIKYLTPFKT